RSCSSLSERLNRELTTRKLPLFYDYLHPQPSHLLNATLTDLFPNQQPFVLKSRTLPSIETPLHMAPGHHLVYFPPQVTLSQLLPDGTDILHSPGDPFNRRLWAGGKVRFPTLSGPLLDGCRAVCLETIRDVTVKGLKGEEKIVVSIERRVGVVKERDEEEEHDIKERIWTENEEENGQASVIETRNLIFMREKTQEQLENDKKYFGEISRIIKPPSDAQFRYRIRPNKSLLFRFSALTFNAHLIHLDEIYTQHMEGYRKLLVHGPLTLMLLLTAMQGHLQPRHFIKGIEYRNLAPLYVDEELIVCGKPKTGRRIDAWDVWIEGPEGGLAVRGSVQT
ncbi:uncharacterized protein ASPGLDRAFT_109883, partial [Aspergillus glaucus CBS 516.65]